MVRPSSFPSISARNGLFAFGVAPVAEHRARRQQGARTDKKPPYSAVMSSYDPTDIQQQERDAEDATKRRRLVQDTEESDFKWLMGRKQGRRIVWRLLEKAGVFRTSFNTNSMAMAFAEGSKNEGLRILALIHTLCPELYPTMVKEANDNRNPDDDSRCNDH